MMFIKTANTITKLYKITLKPLVITGSNPTRQMHSDVIFQNLKDKGIITLNRPSVHNAINSSMIQRIYEKLELWQKEKTLVVIKGAGGKAFCSGGDLKHVMDCQHDANYEENIQDKLHKQYEIFRMIGSRKIPYVALVDGIVMGLGVGMSIHGEFRVATANTVFAMPETQIGLFPDSGSSYFFPRMPGRLGWYLALTGQRLKGADVYLSGVATHFCRSHRMRELECDLLYCTNSADISETLRKYTQPVKSSLSLDKYMDKINECFNTESMDTVFENLKEDDSGWAKRTMCLLEKMSPTSLKITMKALTLGSKMSLNNCLDMEYNLLARQLSTGDFNEGVRALIIEKDKKPKWDPPSIADISDKFIDETYFSEYLLANEQQKPPASYDANLEDQ